MRPEPEASALLPHRPPALLVEQLDHLDSPDGSPEVPEAIVTVGRAGHWLVEGRLSEAGVVEAMAQAAAVCTGNDGADQAREASGVLIGLESVEIRTLPTAGQVVGIRSTCSRRVGPALWVGAEMRAGGEVAATGVIKVFLGPPPTPEGRPSPSTCAGALGETTIGSKAHPDIEATVLAAVIDTAVSPGPARATGPELVTSISARCRYGSSLPIFKGHFPGSPLVPAAYTLQLVVALLRSRGSGSMLPFKVLRAKMARPILPDQHHTVELGIERPALGVQRVSARAQAADDGPRSAVELVLEIPSQGAPGGPQR